MADRAVVEQLVREIGAMLSKKLEGPDMAAAVDAYCRHFQPVANGDLAAAVDAWQSNLGERPPFAPPSVKTLRALLPKNRPGRMGFARAADLPFERPSSEFVAAHVEFKAKWVDRLSEIPGKHDHSNGSGGCPKCQAIDRRADQTRARLAQLPGDPWAGSPRRCRCDGSGMIELKKSKALVVGVRYGADWEAIEVYPCPDCNPVLFGEFREAKV